MIYLRFKDGVLQATDQERPKINFSYKCTCSQCEDREIKYLTNQKKFESSWLPVINHREIIEHIDRLPNRQIQTLIDGKEYQIEGKIERTSEFGTHLSRPMASVIIHEKKDLHEIWNDGQWMRVGEDAYLSAINNNKWGRINGKFESENQEAEFNKMYHKEKPFCGPVVGVPEYGEKKESVEISIPYEEIVRSVASLRAELEMWKEEARTLWMEVESLKAEIYILRK